MQSVHAAVGLPQRLIEALAVAAIVLVPLAVWPTAFESFRLPKEHLSRAIGFAMLPLLVWIPKAKYLRFFNRSRPFALTGGVAAVWTLVRAISAGHHAALDTIIAIVVAALLLVAFMILADLRTARVVYLMFISTAINVAVLTAQRFGASPIHVELNDGTHPATALLGNTNDIGMTLLFPALAGLAATFHESKPRWRVLAATATMIAVAGLLLSYSVTALVAFCCAATVLLIMRFDTVRSRSLAALAVLTIGLTVMTATPSFRNRIEAWILTASAGRWNELMSNRVVPFVAAFEMFTDSPVMGVGPGGFRALYFDYKLRVDERYEFLAEDMATWSLGRVINFGETHNEYLQVMAELGAPGLLLLIGAIVALGNQSLRHYDKTGNTERYAHHLALPMAVGFGVLSLAQFPLRLAAPRLFVLLIVAVCFICIPEQEPR